MVAVLGLALAAAVAMGASARAADEPAVPEAQDTTALPAAQSSSNQTLKKAVWGPTALNGRSLFPTYRDLGIGIYQTSVPWNQTAPTKPADPTDPSDPAYRWPAGLGQTVARAENHGMKVQLMIIGAPPWANGGRTWKWAPQQPKDFADFATAVARRYPSVDLWMIWGEPNRKPNFGPLTPARRTARTRLNHAQARAPRTYAQLLDAAYGALKEVDPANLVIGGNTYTAAGPGAIYTHQWIRYLRLPDGSRPRMDMYGHNPFSFRKPNLKDRPSRRGAVAFGDLRRLAKALDRARFPGAPLKLYLAEWGVPIGFRDKDLLYSLKPKEGVRWIRAGFRIARRWERIYTLGWIHPVDTSRNSQGLLDSSGSPKPGYSAFQAG